MLGVLQMNKIHKMKKFFITLAHTTERAKNFLDSNKHLEFEIFNGVYGKSLNRELLIKENLLDPINDYRAPALGASFSHIKLWNKCIEINEPILICEDDAILKNDFNTRSLDLINKTNVDFDIIFWGWNFDSILNFELDANLGSQTMLFDQEAMRLGKHSYANKDSSNSSLYKLKNLFGLMCYTVSPKGAQFLLNNTVPLSIKNVAVDNLGNIKDVCVDVQMNNYYSKMNSLVCIPPLAITPNDHSISTIQTPLD